MGFCREDWQFNGIEKVAGFMTGTQPFRVLQGNEQFQSLNQHLKKPSPFPSISVNFTIGYVILEESKKCNA